MASWNKQNLNNVVFWTDNISRMCRSKCNEQSFEEVSTERETLRFPWVQPETWNLIRNLPVPCGRGVALKALLDDLAQCHALAAE